MWTENKRRGGVLIGLQVDDKDPATYDNFDNKVWLAKTHLPIAAAGFVYAILYGNEDCPDCVELYARDHYKCKPVVAEHDEKANGLVVTLWGELPSERARKRGLWWSWELTKGK